ncbi:serine/threonine protein kinase [Kitasatospora sp. NPDC054939]
MTFDQINNGMRLAATARRAPHGGYEMWGQGTVLGGRYVLAERLGSGAMGEVWQAEDQVLERRVAVKIVLPALLSDAVFAARFRSEAKTLAALNHRGVVDVYDYGEDEDSTGRLAYIVMELLGGRPLDQVLAELGTLPVGRTLDIVAQMLDAVDAAHRRDIVHRDIKPSNLMLAEDGHLTVTDFGIARSPAGARLTASNAVMGTSLYLAPERCEGRDATPSCDLYSIGVVCYELLVGEVPFAAETALEIMLKHVREPVPELPEELPQAVRSLVLKALAKKPEDRFADAAAMAAAVAGARAELGDAADGGPTVVLGGRRPGKAAGGAAPPVVPPGLPVTPEPKAGPRAEPKPEPKAEPAAGASGAGAESDTSGTSGATTNPSHPRDTRRRTIVAVVVPVMFVTGVVTVDRLDILPWQARADASNGTPLATGSADASLLPTATQSAGAASGSGAPAAPSSTPPPVTAPATGENAPAAGGAGAPVPVPGGQSGGAGAAVGGGSAGGGSAGGGSASGGSAGGGSAGGGQANGGVPGGPGAGGGGAAAGGTSPGTTSASTPASTPPPAPTVPQGCGGAGWGAITNVGSGLAVGLATDSTSSGVHVVMGGHTQFGWVRKDSGKDASFHACSVNHPPLGTMPGGAAVELAQSFYAKTWRLTDVGSGTYLIKPPYNPGSCLTDNGPGRQLTFGGCTPGAKEQIWRIP